MNSLYKYFSTILLIGAGFYHCSAQYTEVGVFLGGSNYIGDLQQNLESSEYNPGFGLQARFVRSKRLSFQGHFYKLRISGNDDNSLNSFTRARNLSVRTDIYELGFQAEFNLSPYEIRANRISAPYIFAGVSGMYFTPQASLMGTWRNLQPLGTEGQTLDGSNNKYSLITPAIPFGIGFRFNLFEKVNLNLELGMRYTFTDYLDDVSGAYPDIEKLQAQDPIAATLSYRSPEYAGEPLSNPVGQARGDGYKNDLVFVGGLGITFNLASGYDLELDAKYKAFRDFQPMQGMNSTGVDSTYTPASEQPNNETQGEMPAASEDVKTSETIEQPSEEAPAAKEDMHTEDVPAQEMPTETTSQKFEQEDTSTGSATSTDPFATPAPTEKPVKKSGKKKKEH